MGVLVVLAKGLIVQRQTHSFSLVLFQIICLFSDHPNSLDPAGSVSCSKFPANKAVKEVVCDLLGGLFAGSELYMKECRQTLL